MRKIFTGIFMLMTGVIASAAEVVEISSPFVRDLEASTELRRLERFLLRTMRGNRSKSGHLQVEFGDPAKSPGMSADLSSSPWLVRISGGRAWAQDLTLTSRTGGILAAVHAGSDSAAVLPQWLSAAWFQTELERRRTERYLSRNRRFPAASALLQSGAVLKPEGFAGILDSAPGSAERLWQQEFGRLLLDLSLVYTPECFGTKIPFFRRPSVSARKNAPQTYAPEVLPAFVWHNPEFIPAAFLERDFQALLKMEIPVIDKEGKATGESMEITLEQLSEQLKKHPGSRNIRNACGRRITEFRRRVPGELAEPLSRLASAVWKLNTSAESAIQLQQAQGLCFQALARRKARSAVLDEAEKKNSSLQRFAPVFSCNDSFSMLTPEERAVFDETDHFFNR